MCPSHRVHEYSLCNLTFESTDDVFSIQNFDDLLSTGLHVYESIVSEVAIILVMYYLYCHSVNMSVRTDADLPCHLQGSIIHINWNWFHFSCHCTSCMLVKDAINAIHCHLFIARTVKSTVVNVPSSEKFLSLWVEDEADATVHPNDFHRSISSSSKSSSVFVCDSACTYCLVSSTADGYTETGQNVASLWRTVMYSHNSDHPNTKVLALLDKSVRSRHAPTFDIFLIIIYTLGVGHSLLGRRGVVWAILYVFSARQNMPFLQPRKLSPIYVPCNIHHATFHVCTCNTHHATFHVSTCNIHHATFHVSTCNTHNATFHISACNTCHIPHFYMQYTLYYIPRLWTFF